MKVRIASIERTLVSQVSKEQMEAEIKKLRRNEKVESMQNFSPATVL
tara:strand:- start:100 stop:240 length:141 start_codon:yes stop_codon:yes gene_type:complete